MLYEVTGDILNNDYDFKFICQQVNCKGVMGSGLAKQIREKYPFVFNDYKRFCDEFDKPLGEIIISRVCGTNALAIVNMFAQDAYGTDKRYTDYDAFESCLNHLAGVLNDYSKDWTVAFPYKIGCGLAGGDWNVIKSLLIDFSTKVKQKVFIVRNPNYRGR